MAERVEEQEKFLKEATTSVKKNAYFMQKAMVSLYELLGLQGCDPRAQITPPSTPHRTRTTCERLSATPPLCLGSCALRTCHRKSTTSCTCRCSTSSLTSRCVVSGARALLCAAVPAPRFAGLSP